MTKQEFINRLAPMAVADMNKTKILASLTLAQAALETGWGGSGIMMKANALFGIKAAGSWKGKVFSSKTQECYDGVNFTTITDLFRAYDSWEESVADHSALFTGLKRYAAVVGETDYKKACKAVHAAGYATAPTYADTLIAIIEQNKFYDFDKQESKPAVPSTPKSGDIIGNVLYTDIKAYLSGELVESVNINGMTYIDFELLKKYGKVTWDEKARILTFVPK